MNAPAGPPTASPATPQGAAAAPRKARRFRLPAPSRRVGCLGVWLVVLTPVAYSLLLACCPPFAGWVNERLAVFHPPFSASPPFFVPWLTPGPARGLTQWLGNIDSGPTMVYLICVAVLVLLSAAVFVRGDGPPRQ